MPDYSKYKEVAELLKVLGHPVRLCIVQGLINQERNVTKMQECLKLPQPTISQHLAILKSKGIVEGERKGIEITYRVINEKIKNMMDLLLS